MSVKPGWEGRYFEDFEIGDIYRCRIGRTVTEADNIWFTLLTNNTNQIHFNNEYGKRTEFGKCLINSALTLAIVAGLGVADVSENGFALGWDEIKLPNPLFAGDTLYSESEVLEKRESKSKPQWGIIKVRTRGIQQEGKVVIDYARNVFACRHGCGGHQSRTAGCRRRDPLLGFGREGIVFRLRLAQPQQAQLDGGCEKRERPRDSSGAG